MTTLENWSLSANMFEGYPIGHRTVPETVCIRFIGQEARKRKEGIMVLSTDGDAFLLGDPINEKQLPLLRAKYGHAVL